MVDLKSETCWRVVGGNGDEYRCGIHQDTVLPKEPPLYRTGRLLSPSVPVRQTGGTRILSRTVSATCQPVSDDASLTVTKTCTTGLEAENDKVVVVVNIAGTVRNVPPDPATGQVPETINGIVVTDDPAIDPINIGNLSPGSCQNYTSKYYPTVVQGGGTAAEQTYTDTVTATGTGLITGTNRFNTASANCPLCPPVH